MSRIRALSGPMCSMIRSATTVVRGGVEPGLFRLAHVQKLFAANQQCLHFPLPGRQGTNDSGLVGLAEHGNHPGVDFIGLCQNAL